MVTLYTVECSCGWAQKPYSEVELRLFYGDNWNNPEKWLNGNPEKHKFKWVEEVD